MKLSLLCIALFLSHTAFSQTTPVPRNNQVKLSLFNLMDNINPGIEIGYERIYAKRWATQVSYTFLTSLGAANLYSQYYHRFSGRRYIIEQKYYLRSRNESRLRHYVALDYTNLRADGTEDMEYASAPRSRVYVRDTIDIRRKTGSVNLRWGMQLYIIRKRVVLDFTTGFGLKHREVIVTGQEPGLGALKTWDIFNMYRNEKDWKINIPLNVRVGYRF